jgi:hypothetical protein
VSESFAEVVSSAASDVASISESFSESFADSEAPLLDFSDDLSVAESVVWPHEAPTLRKTADHVHLD